MSCVGAAAAAAAAVIRGTREEYDSAALFEAQRHSVDSADSAERAFGWTVLFRGMEKSVPRRRVDSRAQWRLLPVDSETRSLVGLGSMYLEMIEIDDTYECPTEEAVRTLVPSCCRERERERIRRKRARENKGRERYI